MMSSDDAVMARKTKGKGLEIAKEKKSAKRSARIPPTRRRASTLPRITDSYPKKT